ncbi:MAG: isoprenylcysteine carboxylmethyltransferase family protein [Chitinophagaceae bacterium]|nr:MAG: isoprenylcysteine carboxylmethyltransferase family protein [Chitinophagaceae bacterium]
MKSSPKHAAVYIPPPLIGIIIFLFSLGIQSHFPVSRDHFHNIFIRITGWIFIGAAMFFGGSGVFRFFKTKNTVETFKPASSLQTSGIYTISRNPMYAGLVSLYIGLAFIIENGWTVILTPLFIFILQTYVIRREEYYLTHAFGEPYLIYKNSVRRWLGRKKKGFPHRRMRKAGKQYP